MRRLFAVAALLIAPQLFAADAPKLPAGHSVRELRLGVVCYGGVSLAIYMYGNVRELHHLALASTALECDAEGGAACGAIVQGKAWDQLPRGAQQYYQALVDKWADEGVRTRVVVDVISGTSAGGINGIFLAKALDRNLPLDGLRGLWFEEADISRLAGRPWPLRAAWRLLTKRPALRGDTWLKAVHLALEEMDQKAKPSRLPTLLAERQPLDLLVTATDFFGTERTLEIGRPATSSELRYDHVFHFSNGGNRIGFDNNVALAFAARSSASFPVAFPSIRLQDLTEILGEKDPAKLAVLFGDRLVERRDEPDAATKLTTELFLVDGGILDNYPFDIAYRRISHRTPALETQREFIYLEPDPRVPSEKIGERQQPKPLQMALGAATRIPGAEPIAQDLLNFAQHNRRVARIRGITRHDETLARDEVAGRVASEESVAKQVEDAMQLGEKVLANPEKLQNAMMDDAGQAAGDRRPVSDLPPAARNAAYQQLEQNRKDIENDAKSKSPIVEEAYARLRVHSVLDQFARVISTELCRFPEDFEGRQTSLVRELVLQWAAKEDSPVSLDRDEFLQAFDIGYVRRKLRFVNDWLNMQYRPEAYEEHNYGLDRLQIQSAQKAISGRIDALTNLLRGQNLERYGLGPEFAAAATVACVRPNDKEAASQAKQIVDDVGKRKVLNDLVNALQARLLVDQRQILGDLYGDFVSQTADWPDEASRVILARYLGFPYWDRASYPYTAFSGTGDLTKVSITRFSPTDATTLTGKGAAKLAGEGLGHFGAFLDRNGREQDYLWGRLDGAEHVFALIAPPTDKLSREERVLQTLDAIMDEEETNPVVSQKNLQVLRGCVDKPKSCS